MKKKNIDEIAEYSAAQKKPREKRTLGGRAIIALLAVTAAVLVAAVVTLSLYYTGAFDVIAKKKTEEPTNEQTVYEGFSEAIFSDSRTGDYATFTFTADGKTYTFTVYLFASYAPNTVNNFLVYAKDGFYDGTTVQRSVVTGAGEEKKGIVTCGGFVRNTAGEISRKVSEKYSGAIKGEFMANGYAANRLANKKGVIGMLHSDQSYDDATTDFYLLPYDNEAMNGYYAAFGKVTNANGLTAMRQVALLASEGTIVTLQSVTVQHK